VAETLGGFNISKQVAGEMQEKSTIPMNKTSDNWHFRVHANHNFSEVCLHVHLQLHILSTDVQKACGCVAVETSASAHL